MIRPKEEEEEEEEEGGEKKEANVSSRQFFSNMVSFI